MLKKVTQAKVLSWTEVDLYLNNIADFIFLQTNTEKVISYSVFVCKKILKKL